MTLSTLNNIAAPVSFRTIFVACAWMKKRLGLMASRRRHLAVQGELRSLTAAQLRDAGIDKSEISTGPVFEIEARTMTDLMSMR